MNKKGLSSLPMKCPDPMLLANRDAPTFVKENTSKITIKLLLFNEPQFTKFS